MHFLPENRMCAPPFVTKQCPPIWKILDLPLQFNLRNARVICGGSLGTARQGRASRSKFFNFHAVFGKNLAHPFESWTPNPGKSWICYCQSLIWRDKLEFYFQFPYKDNKNWLMLFRLRQKIESYPQTCIPTHELLTKFRAGVQVYGFFLLPHRLGKTLLHSTLK